MCEGSENTFEETSFLFPEKLIVGGGKKKKKEKSDSPFCTHDLHFPPRLLRGTYSSISLRGLLVFGVLM